MDDIVDQLARELIERFKHLESDRRLLIGIAGIPGSGKSTIAYPLADRVNAILCSPGSSPSSENEEFALDPKMLSVGGVARCVGLDGWHLSRAQLSMSEDPEQAFARRGAPFTYDLEGYGRFVKSAKSDLLSHIDFPTFEHHIKDPVPSAVPLLPSNRILIIEGLYTILDEPGWGEISDHIDVAIYVDTPRSIARERCIKRNFAAGVADTLEATTHRVDASDMINGDLVRTKSRKPTFIINGA